MRRPASLAPDVSDAEEGDVVMVVGPGRTHERKRALGMGHDRAEAEHVAVEPLGGGRVTHVQHGVVHPRDRHDLTPISDVIGHGRFGLMV